MEKAVASTTAITEYSATEAALSGLRLRLEGVKYDVSTTAGMTTAKQDRRELVTLRTSLEAKRKEIKVSALVRCKLIDEEAKRITSELLALEVPIDEQIKAEERRKAEEKAERDRLAAEAQKILDDKIAAISQLPLKVIGKDSTEITVFLAALEAKEFGGEFAGDTLVRAQAAKQSAVDTIRQALADTLAAEERAAQAEAERIEREAREAAEQEAKRIEDAKRKAEFERQQAELAEQKRVQDIENDRIRKEQEERDRQLAKQREEAQAEIDRQAAELKRQQEEMQAKIDAENAKIEAERLAHEAKMKAEQEELDRKRREEEAEKVRIAAAKAAEEERARLAAEHAQKLAEAKCADAATAFRRILDICNSNMSAMEMVTAIAIIAEGNL